jgi:hypothetical protein
MVCAIHTIGFKQERSAFPEANPTLDNVPGNTSQIPDNALQEKTAGIRDTLDVPCFSMEKALVTRPGEIAPIDLDTYPLRHPADMFLPLIETDRSETEVPHEKAG